MSASALRVLRAVGVESEDGLGQSLPRQSPDSSRPASNCGPRSRCSPAWAPRPSQRAPSTAAATRSTSSNAVSRPAKNSVLRRHRSPGSPATGFQPRDRRAVVHQPPHGPLPPRKVFAKLNVTSRNQLQRVLSDGAGEGSVAAAPKSPPAPPAPLFAGAGAARRYCLRSGRLRADQTEQGIASRAIRRPRTTSTTTHPADASQSAPT